MVYNPNAIAYGLMLQRKKSTADGEVHARKLRETQIFYSRERGQAINPQSNSIEFEETVINFKNARWPLLFIS